MNTLPICSMLPWVMGQDVMTPESITQNLILKWEGYPIEYHAELPIPPSKSQYIWGIKQNASDRGWHVYITYTSVSITVPEDAGECFTHELHSYGIVPVWVRVIKD